MNKDKGISTKDYNIEKGTVADGYKLELLYNDLNEYLESHINYPGWKKNVYPIKETAIKGINEDALFVIKIDGVIAGSIILNHEPESAYSEAIWGIEADYEDIIVVHTLVVHPKFMKNGIGKKLMEFARQFSISHGVKTIRLDVSIHNSPAIALYEKCGFKYVDTVDLGLKIPDLVWFKLYELIL